MHDTGNQPVSKYSSVVFIYIVISKILVSLEKTRTKIVWFQLLCSLCIALPPLYLCEEKKFGIRYVERWIPTLTKKEIDRMIRDTIDIVLMLRFGRSSDKDFPHLDDMLNLHFDFSLWINFFFLFVFTSLFTQNP